MLLDRKLYSLHLMLVILALCVGVLFGKEYHWIVLALWKGSVLCLVGSFVRTVVKGRVSGRKAS